MALFVKVEAAERSKSQGILNSEVHKMTDSSNSNDTEAVVNDKENATPTAPEDQVNWI